MCCTINQKAPLGVCTGVHAGIAGGMAIAGATVAFLVTSATVATLAITAGVFAAPAIVVGVLAVTAYALLSPDTTKHENLKYMHGIHAVVFALVSGAAIAAGIALGILASTALIVTFAVAAAIVTLTFAGLAIYKAIQTPGDPNELY